MATLGVTFTGAALSMSGGKKTDDPTTPPINAKSSDEENFVKCVLYPPIPRTSWLARIGWPLCLTHVINY